MLRIFILVSFLLSATSMFIGEFYVPWVQTDWLVNSTFFPVYMPVKIGLINCFGETCKLAQQMKGFQSSSFSTDSSSKETPYVIGSILVILCSCISIVCIAAAVAVEATTISTSRPPSHKTPSVINLFGCSVFFNAISVAGYCLATVGFLDNGKYIQGFWMCFSTVLLGVVLFTIFATFLHKPNYVVLTDTSDSSLNSIPTIPTAEPYQGYNESSIPNHFQARPNPRSNNSAGNQPHKPSSAYEAGLLTVQEENGEAKKSGSKPKARLEVNI